MWRNLPSVNLWKEAHNAGVKIKSYKIGGFHQKTGVTGWSWFFIIRLVLTMFDQF
jgi:hypothetical protein